MRNGNLLKSRVSEICVKQIRLNQGVGVCSNKKLSSEPLVGAAQNSYCQSQTWGFKKCNNYKI